MAVEAAAAKAASKLRVLTTYTDTVLLLSRPAIDSPLPTLPLLTSLQHLAYLTSTSPRIREILTLDGGLERLITVVAGCLDLAFPADPATQAKAQNQQATRRPRRIIPFKPFAAYANGSLGQDYVDGHALLHTYGFALQCLVNVGVRGSEQIRTRVVEAGVLSVVARILSGFLAARRREKERRQASAEPTRSITLWRDQNGQIPLNDRERTAEAMNVASVTTTAPTPISNNRNNAIVAQNLEEAVTVSIANFAAATAAIAASQQTVGPAQPSTLPPNAARMPLVPIHRTNTPDTVASIDEVDQQSEQDNDAESSGQENENEQMDTEEESGVASHTSSRRRRGTVVPKLDTLTIHRHHHLHRAGSSSAPSPTASDITPSAPTPQNGEVDQDGDVVMDAAQQQHQQAGYFDTSATPRGRNTLLPHNSISAVPLQQHQHTPSQSQQQSQQLSQEATQTPLASSANQPLPSDYHFKEDDVLHCLHLLAYLSKYPHVRAVFHDPENETCRPPPSSPSTSTSNLPACCSGQQNCSRKKQRCGENGEACSSTCSENHAHDQDVMNDDEDECTGGRDTHPSTSTSRCPHSHSPPAHSHSQAQASTSHSHAMDEDDDDQDLARAKAMASLPAKDRKPAAEPSRPPRSTANNVFSLVEQFTFRPSSASDRSMGPRLPTEIQYWAGVIMRNACRKDEVRGGIRQCANMGCGVWERFPREFAKCRRCRKAKYCSKSCQKRAWQAGHR